MLDLIFPDLCVYCKNHSPNSDLCSSCYSKISFVSTQNICIKCGTPFNLGSETGHGHKCGACIEKERYYTKCRSVALFDGLIRELLHLFKYRKKLGIGKLCGKLLTENLPGAIEDFDLIVPVPMHIRKLREREFNQCAVLSKYLSGKTGKEYDPFTLIKLRETEAQVVFKNAGDRRKNVYKSFSVRFKDRIKKRSVLIIDDVYTTGSTVNECARVLLESGASKVLALTLLRADV